MTRLSLSRFADHRPQREDLNRNPLTEDHMIGRPIAVQAEVAQE